MDMDITADLTITARGVLPAADTACTDKAEVVEEVSAVAGEARNQSTLKKCYEHL